MKEMAALGLISPIQSVLLLLPSDKKTSFGTFAWIAFFIQQLGLTQFVWVHYMNCKRLYPPPPSKKIL
jgi:hypothetical protein